MAEKPGLTKAAARAVGETLGERVARGELRDARAHEIMRAIAESVTHSKARLSDLLDGYDVVFLRKSIGMPKRRNPPRGCRRAGAAASSSRQPPPPRRAAPKRSVYEAVISAGGRRHRVEFRAADDGAARKYATSGLLLARYGKGARAVSLKKKR